MIAEKEVSARILEQIDDCESNLMEVAYAAVRSYRLVSDAYRKETFQEVNCSSRSLQDMVVTEGKKINKVLENKSLEILQEHGVTHTRSKTEVSE